MHILILILKKHKNAINRFVRYGNFIVTYLSILQETIAYCNKVTFVITLPPISYYSCIVDGNSKTDSVTNSDILRNIH